MSTTPSTPSTGAAPYSRQSSHLFGLLTSADAAKEIRVSQLAPELIRRHREVSRQSEAIIARGELPDYRLAHAARADLCRRLGRTADARTSYQRALALTRQEPERRFLERRLAGLKH